MPGSVNSAALRWASKSAPLSRGWTGGSTIGSIGTRSNPRCRSGSRSASEPNRGHGRHRASIHGQAPRHGRGSRGLTPPRGVRHDRTTSRLGSPVSSAQRCARREIPKQPYLLTAIQLTCGAAITGPGRNASSRYRESTYVWRRSNRHSRSETGIMAISPYRDSTYVWHRRNRHNRSETGSIVISHYR